jgi:hypothetical protein
MENYSKIYCFRRSNQKKFSLDLKQPYCRDLRDCQTYFPCAVFSNGFTYLYVIKRCPNEQIFDETQQKCVTNTFTEPICSKNTYIGKSKLTTNRPPKIKHPKRRNNTARQPRKNPLRSPSINILTGKNFDLDQIEDKEGQSITESPVQLQTQQNNENTKILRVCYITNWSRYRSNEAKFEIEYIDPFMCSHIIYAYAKVDDDRPEIVPIQKEDIGK